MNQGSTEGRTESEGTVKQPRDSRPRVRVKAKAFWDYMERRSLSQNDLAKEVGLSPGYVSQMVNGRRSPSARTRRSLLEALGAVEFDDIFFIEATDEG